MRVATYTRISTDEENQPYSLEAQADRLAMMFLKCPLKFFRRDQVLSLKYLSKPLHWLAHSCGRRNPGPHESGAIGSPFRFCTWDVRNRDTRKDNRGLRHTVSRIKSEFWTLDAHIPHLPAASAETNAEPDGSTIAGH